MSEVMNAERSITIKLPRLDWQSVVLGLIVVVALLQTVQLLSLRNNGLSARPANASSVPPASSADSSHSGGDLEGMVGGC